MNGYADRFTKRLHSLYSNRGISVAAFDCKYAHSCQAEEHRKLCRGAEAHVGEMYGDPVRIVFVSHDTGADGQESPRGECLEVRRNIVQAVQLIDKPNPHMRGTILTLKEVLPDTPEGDLLKKFALTNSAKCSGDSSGSVHNELYRNCRNHGLAELRELEPHLVVTQGVHSRDMLGPLQYLTNDELSSFDLREGEKDQVRRYLRRWTGDGGDVDVVVIKAPHPSAPGPWHEFRTNALRPVCKVVREQLLPRLIV